MTLIRPLFYPFALFFLFFTFSYIGKSNEKSNLHKIIQTYNELARKPYTPYLHELASTINQKVLQEKDILLPEYETLFIIDDENFSSFSKNEGRKFSLLKYGHPEVIKEYASILAQRIRARFGKELQDKNMWRIAGTAYFRTRNAATALAQETARLLDIPVIDIRSKSFYPGEFGALTNSQLRLKIMQETYNIFISNPYEAMVKNIIYIDDAFVSGAHLAEHIRVLKQGGAASVFPFAIVDVISKKLSLEKNLNFAEITPNNLPILLQFLKNPETPILTRTAKFILRLPPEKLFLFLKELPDNKIYELCETSDNEGYPFVETFSVGYKILEKEAILRHNKSQKTNHSDIKFLILDYDETIEPSLKSLSPRMLDHIIFFLERGAHIAIVTMQPLHSMTSPCLLQTVIGPLRRYLEQRKINPQILNQLHFFSSCGLYYHSFTYDSSLEKPVYFLGLSSQETHLLMRSLENKIEPAPKDAKIRDGYLTFYFHDQIKQEHATQWFRQFLNPKLNLEVNPYIRKEKFIVKIQPFGSRKAIARSYIMTQLIPFLERDKGLQIKRENILTAGDRMGISTGENDDSGLFVYNATNLALGKEAREGAETEYLGQYAEGLAQWFAHFRKLPTL